MLNINLGPFAVQVSHLLLLASALVTLAIGHRVGRRRHVGIGSVLVDMLWAALLASRVAFVAIWFDGYRGAPWSMLDLRDGGFTPWAGLVAALLVALWRGWRSAALREPLIWGLAAGALAWSVMSGAAATLNPRLPSVPLKTLAGEPTDLAATARGQPMVVNLWATWCPPCRREMPVLAAAQQQESGVTFVFANQGESAATTQRYLSGSSLNLANVLLDSGAELGRAIGSTALPTTLFYDANGRLVDTHLGALSAASLASKLDRWRASAAPSTQP